MFFIVHNKTNETIDVATCAYGPDEEYLCNIGYESSEDAIRALVKSYSKMPQRIRKMIDAYVNQLSSLDGLLDEII